ncbi:MAG: cytochrome c [Zoogloeaceae bacterium]|nr:cytochrome c [Zoogloeaceae bacterium]
MKKTILALAALAMSGSVLAQALKPADAIKTRQAGYRYLSWSVGKIKANVEGNAYNKAEVIAAARTIAAIANSGMGALYIPGSEKDVGSVKTYVKPEFFQNQQEVGKVAQDFNREANAIAEVASTGDAAAVKAQLGKLGGTCKACHDKFKNRD